MLSLKKCHLMRRGPSQRQELQLNAVKNSNRLDRQKLVGWRGKCKCKRFNSKATRLATQDDFSGSILAFVLDW
jgi:hypothetical protein